ncbi:MAG: hypothetical protein IPK81_10295 [Rhodospirillales bacterium]|nr:MAG: hypothetical protein IPK81_10295 [Rhodospirillales bacterium]
MITTPPSMLVPVDAGRPDALARTTAARACGAEFLFGEVTGHCRRVRKFNDVSGTPPRKA